MLTWRVRKKTTNNVPNGPRPKEWVALHREKKSALTIFELMDQGFETADGATHVFFLGFDCDPPPTKVLCSGSGRVAPSKWVNDEVLGFREEFDEELRKIRRHPRRVGRNADFSAPPVVIVIPRGVGVLKYVRRDRSSVVLEERLLSNTMSRRSLSRDRFLACSS